MPVMNSGLGGPAGYGENVYSTTPKVAGNVDDGSISIDLTSVFGAQGINFFGTNYTSLFLNSNGLITFDAAETAYTPVGIAGFTEPAIAPFWSDVDVNKGGEIYWDIDPINGQVTFTWLDVAPYQNAATAGTNSFQVVLTSNGNGDFEVEFIYENIDWTNGYTGDATVGVTDGASQDFELEGSGNSTILQNYDSNDFDVGQEDGVWSFRVRDGLPDYRDYVVEGTNIGEVIDTSFVDEDGDRIDNGDHIDDSDDDEVAAGGGNDSVLAGVGDDTVRGDEGNDTLLGEAGSDILTGGTGNDSLVGGADDDTFVYSAGDGADTIADFNTGNSGALGDGDETNNDFIDLSAFYDSMGELRDDFDDDGILNQSNGSTVDYSNNDQFGISGGLTFQGVGRLDLTADNTGVVCFTKGTLIRTVAGDVPVETLAVGDRVETRDNGPQVIRWVGQRRLGRSKLLADPSLKPVHIAPGLIGADAPLIVSPQHGVLMTVEGQEMLVRAKHLAMMDGGQARFAAGQREVVYYHILLDGHQIIFANGAPSESFYPGPQALGALNAEAQNAVLALLPQVTRWGVFEGYGATSRPFARRKALPEALRALAIAA